MVSGKEVLTTYVCGLIYVCNASLIIDMINALISDMIQNKKGKCFNGLLCQNGITFQTNVLNKGQSTDKIEAQVSLTCSVS